MADPYTLVLAGEIGLLALVFVAGVYSTRRRDHCPGPSSLDGQTSHTQPIRYPVENVEKPVPDTSYRGL